VDKLVKIWIDSPSDGERKRHSIRIDWDNDRHQSIHLRSLSAEDVAEALKRRGRLLMLKE
jgi:hypothetical protein